MLSTNAVRLNQTSTLAWALVWSAPSDFKYFGNGLMYAYAPWSGHYVVNDAVWTSAHHTQFASPGWWYTAGGRGTLRGGGSFVSLVDAAKEEVTVILEKLAGDCLRCAGDARTEFETVHVRLAPRLATRHATLAVWRTNATRAFWRAPDVTVGADGRFEVDLEPDSLITVSSTTGQVKGSFPDAPVPPRAAFKLPYSEDFEARRSPPVGFARFFADNGGSFELAVDETDASNRVLAQVVAEPPRNNAWVQDRSPITVIGETVNDSRAVSVAARVRVPADAVNGGGQGDDAVCAGVCARVQGGGGAQCDTNGHCALLCRDDRWYLTENGTALADGPLAATFAGAWHALKLRATDKRLALKVNGTTVGAATTQLALSGMAALVSYWHRAFFDDFELSDSEEPETPPETQNEPTIRPQLRSRDSAPPLVMESHDIRSNF